MPSNVAVVLAAFIIMTSVFVLIAVTSRRQRQAKEDEMRQAASARGWKFESVLEKGYRVHRWSGSTDGIAWVAESLRHTAGGNKRSRRRHISRWHGTFSPGINGAIAAMGVPKGKEVMGEGIAQGEGFIVRLAQKAAGFAFDKALDMYFGEQAGKEVDAGTMHRVDGQRVPGMIIMAADKDEGTRVLAQGLERALLDGTRDQSSALSDEDRPWILLRPHALSLARMETFRDATELERFTRAGISLTRAFKFGRAVS